MSLIEWNPIRVTRRASAYLSDAMRTAAAKIVRAHMKSARPIWMALCNLSRSIYVIISIDIDHQQAKAKYYECGKNMPVYKKHCRPASK